MDVTAPLDRLADFIEGSQYQGYDPYDGLNSPLLAFIGRAGKYPRIAAIQFMKRCPINLRPLLGIRKGYNPKGLGLFLWGYAKLLAAGCPGDHPLKINHLLSLLADCRSSDCSGNGWGYNFNWQSRAFYVPKHTPTIVNSSFIGHALLDTYEVTRQQRALDLAVPIQDFILSDLTRTIEGETFCFSYTPIDQIAVHNANLLGASLLIRLHAYTGDSAAREAALASLAYSMNYQRENGSWWYANTSYQKWIDSFHTGFNLQAIRYFLKLNEGEEHSDAYEKGVRYYAENFFLQDGTAKYYQDRREPIDIHSFAQAIVFFAPITEYGELVDRVLHCMLRTFQSRRGYFYFQRSSRGTNRIPYMRWGQAWAFHALTEYVLARAMEAVH